MYAQVSTYIRTVGKCVPHSLDEFGSLAAELYTQLGNAQTLILLSHKQAALVRLARYLKTPSAHDPFAYGATRHQAIDCVYRIPRPIRELGGEARRGD